MGTVQPGPLSPAGWYQWSKRSLHHLHFLHWPASICKHFSLLSVYKSNTNSSIVLEWRSARWWLKKRTHFTSLRFRLLTCCYHVVIICYLGDVWSRSNTQPVPIAATTGNSLWFFKKSNLLETLAVLSHVFFYKAVKITIMLLTRSKIERIQLEVPKKT